MSDLLLRRKLTLRAHGRKVVFVKKPRESVEHVATKAVLWSLYLPAYPDLAVEIGIGDRYKPDLVQLDAAGRPVFWGESGKVAKAKVASLLRRYPDTHFALAKWGEPLAPHAALVRDALDGRPRRAPFDLLGIPADAPARFFNDGGEVTVSWGDVERIRFADDG